MGEEAKSERWEGIEVSFDKAARLEQLERGGEGVEDSPDLHHSPSREIGADPVQP